MNKPHFPPIPPWELEKGAADVSQSLIPPGIYLDQVIAVTFRVEDQQLIADVTHLFYDGKKVFRLTASTYCVKDVPTPQKGDTELVVFAYDDEHNGDVVLRNTALLPFLTHLLTATFE